LSPQKGTQTPIQSPERRESVSRPILSPQAAPQEDDYKDCERAIAIYDYDAQEANELSFKVSDEIIIIKRYPNSQWCKGKHGQKIGLFPANFVKTKTAGKMETNFGKVQALFVRYHDDFILTLDVGL
jgi:hypothetical protein